MRVKETLSTFGHPLCFLNTTTPFDQINVKKFKLNKKQNTIKINTKSLNYQIPFAKIYI